MPGEHYDIVVIGAGIAGVATAQHLLMQGRKVLLIDRRGAGQETSYGNAGVIGNGYVLPFGFPPLNRIPAILLDRDTSARVRYADLPRVLPWIVEFFLKSQPKPRRITGERLRPLISRAVEEHRVLMYGTDAEQHMGLSKQATLYRSEDAFRRNAFERGIAKEINVPFEIMDMAAFRDIEPNIKPAFHKVVRWTSGAHLNNPGKVVAAYAERFVRGGGSFIQESVRRLTQTGDAWHITTSQGDITAQQVVMCAGPWSGEILKSLGYSFPLAFKRGYHQHYAGPQLNHAITDAEYGYVVSHMEQGTRITSGAEFAALDAPPTPVQIARILPYARELFTLGKPVEATPWHGSRPCFTDSLPVIGAAPRHQGLWLNFGHGHMGMTIGPASGRLLAEMLSGLQPFCDPYPYRAARFSC